MGQTFLSSIDKWLVNTGKIKEDFLPIGTLFKVWVIQDFGIFRVHCKVWVIQDSGFTVSIRSLDNYQDNNIFRWVLSLPYSSWWYLRWCRLFCFPFLSTRVDYSISRSCSLCYCIRWLKNKWQTIFSFCNISNYHTIMTTTAPIYIIR